MRKLARGKCCSDCIEMTTGDSPELAVIWLHGLGADGHDFEPIVPELGLRFARAVRVSARARAARDDQRRHGDACLVRHSRLRSAARSEDAAGIRASATAVTALIDRELERGIPAERIVLAGFSQGGAIALHTALREPRALAGVLALSTYLPVARHARERAQRRERGHSDLHGARHGGLGAAALARRVLAACARGARLQRRLARLSDGALGLCRGDQRDRRVARGVAGEPRLGATIEREALAHLADELPGRVERALGERRPPRCVDEHDRRATRAVSRADDEVRALVALLGAARVVALGEQREQRLDGRRMRRATRSVPARALAVFGHSMPGGALLNACSPSRAESRGTARLLAK